MSDVTPEAATPGQAAYEGYERAVSGDPGYKPFPWGQVDRRGRRNWDAAAAAASQAALPRVLAAAARCKAERDAAWAEVNRIGDLLGTTSNAKCDAIEERDAARAEITGYQASCDGWREENSRLEDDLAAIRAERDDWHEAADGWEGNFHAARKDADRYRQALERIAMGTGIMSQAQASVIAAKALGSGDDPIAEAVASGRDRYRAALERVLRILRGEGIEVMDDAELAAVIARALGEDGQ